MNILNIAVTGAAGQIGYSLIPMICNGSVFGPNTKINLRLLDIPQCESVLQGVAMEIQDGAYEQVESVQFGSDPKEMFKDLDLGIFVGGFPRKEGMERKDLLQMNGKIFIDQGKALNEVAKDSCRCLVVANPANTNCLILSKYASKIPKQNFTALTRLDQNRAIGQLSQKANCKAIKNVIIWGNHSSTQYPDVNHATIDGKPVKEVIQDQEYLSQAFIEKVQKRGAEIIKVKKTSSVFSAANATKDHLKDWYFGSKNIVSMGIISQGQYGVEQDIVYSFPIRCSGDFKYEVVLDLKIDEYSQNKMKITEKELLEEKNEALN